VTYVTYLYRALYGLYAWLVFIVCVVFALFATLLMPTAPLRHKLASWASRAIFILAGVPADIRGLENLPDGQAVRSSISCCDAPGQIASNAMRSRGAAETHARLSKRPRVASRWRSSRKAHLLRSPAWADFAPVHLSRRSGAICRWSQSQFPELERCYLQAAFGRGRYDRTSKYCHPSYPVNRRSIVTRNSQKRPGNASSPCSKSRTGVK